MKTDFTEREFVCTDCGRRILAFGKDTISYCAACIVLPGWFDEPKLRQRINPDWQPSPP